MKEPITLSTLLTSVFRLTDLQKAAAKKLSLETIDDLLRYLPSRYIDTSNLISINESQPGAQVTIEGKVLHLDAKKTFQKRLNITEAHITDNTGEITAVWFHQPYVSRLLAENDLVRLEGKISERKGKLFISNPIYQKISVLSYRGSGARMIPIYPTTRGLSSRWIQFHISKIFQEISSDLPDPIPKNILEQYHLPDLYSAFRATHFPKNEKEVEASRKRLAFEEIFFIQLTRMRERLALEETSALPISRDKKIEQGFLNRLPFALTKTQAQILETILEDMSHKTPMARLLEGDVGSGKTIIAALVAHMTRHAGFQTTYMAPTEILARQHFDSFAKLMGSQAVKIGLLTSSEARIYPSKAFANQSAHIPKSQLLRWLESGEVKILIGTHSLLSEKNKFKNLAFIVIDEQHRFGVRQRMKLAHSKSTAHEFVPHFLSMTATPIPRTLALTVFGDLDLSVLDELPPGRSPIKSEVLIKPEKRSWEHVRKEIENGRQAFIICPRIDPGEDESKSVKKEYERMTNEIFPEFRTAMLHGKMTPRDKERTLNDFRLGTTNILISTSVVEVGIDIPNATIMIVEGADRFGLAQLHQLRGRIGRGKHQSYFYAVSETANAKTAQRLRALRDASSGFELAEHDLRLRGPGELTGKNQWGLSDIGMEALKNIKMVEAARTEARTLLANDRELKKYPALQEKITILNQTPQHFE